MAPRKVLMITYHFPPSGAVASFRLLGFARHLPGHGWQPIIVAPPRVPGEPEDPDLVKLVPPQTAVVSVPVPTGWFARLIGRVAPFALWRARARKACAQAIREHRPEVVFTTGPPHCLHSVGLYVKERFGLPWVACFRDPWYTNKVPRPLSTEERRGIEQEQEVVAGADLIIANTPLNCSGFQQAYPEHRHKFVTITNGYDPDMFPRPAGLSGPRERLAILHAGELYSGRDPRPFLDAVRDLETGARNGQPRFRLRFLGRATEHLFDLSREVQTRGLSGLVDLVGQVPYRDALRQMTEADILLLVHTPGHRVGVPAKLYEYLGAGKPILALAEPDGDIAWVLENSGLPYRIAPPQDSGRIRQALVELAELAKSPPAPRTAVTALTRDQLSKQLAQTLDACLPAARVKKSTLDLAAPA
jgi:glycosyltransferase involved in cell wall biosynthesis